MIGSLNFAETYGSSRSIPVRREFIDITDGQIHYRSAGNEHDSDIPLLCFHGIPESSYLYKDLLPYLGVRSRVLAMDTPGFGESFRPLEPPDVWQYADWLAEAALALGYDRFDLLGHTAGAAIAAALTAIHPELVRRLVLWAPPLFTERYRGPSAFPERPLADGSHLIREWQRLVGSAQAANSVLSIQDSSDRFMEVYRGGQNAIWGEEAVKAFPLADVLPQIGHRTLVIQPLDYKPDVELAAALVSNSTVIKRNTPWLTALTLDALWHSEVVSEFLDQR